jgi:hypothetical protein
MTKRISELPATGSVADTDELELNQAGLSRKATRGQIVAGLASAAHQHDLADISDAGALAALDKVTTAVIDSAAYASAAQAIAGTDNTKIMTALRTQELIDQEIADAFSGEIVAATPDMGVFLLKSDHIASKGVVILADQAVDIQVQQTVAEGSQFDIRCIAASVSFSIQGWANTGDGYVDLNGSQLGSVELIYPGRVNVLVQENPGSVPVIDIIGGVDGIETTLSGPLDANNEAVSNVTVSSGWDLNEQTIAGNATLSGDLTLGGTVDIRDDVTLDASASGAGLINATRSDAGTAIAVADSGKYIISDGALTIPNTAIGNGWFNCLLEVGANTHDIDFNSITLDISAAGFAAGDVYMVVVKSGTTIKIQGPAGVFDQTDFA